MDTVPPAITALRPPCRAEREARPSQSSDAGTGARRLWARLYLADAAALPPSPLVYTRQALSREGFTLARRPRRRCPAVSRSAARKRPYI